MKVFMDTAGVHLHSTIEDAIQELDYVGAANFYDAFVLPPRKGVFIEGVLALIVGFVTGRVAF